MFVRELRCSLPTSILLKLLARRPVAEVEPCDNLSQAGLQHRWQGSQSRDRPIAPGNFTESFAPLGPVDSGSFFFALWPIPGSFGLRFIN